MGMTNTVKTTFALTLCLLSIPNRGPAAQKVRIEREGAVVVVRNPKQPVERSGRPTRLRLIEDLTIGRSPDSETYVFSSLSGLVVDEDGRMFALDGRAVRIMEFDPGGVLIRSFGSKGEGPGELASAMRMSLHKDREIVIHDSRNNRMSFFSKTGDWLRSVPLGKHRALLATVDNLGRFHALKFSFGDQINLNLIRFDSEFRPVRTLFELRQPPEPPPAWDKIMDIIHFHSLEDGTLIWGHAEEYTLHVLNPEGEERMRIHKDHDRVSIGREDILRAFKERFPNREAPEVIPPGLPKHYPPLYDFRCDDRGRIYVRTHEKNRHGHSRWDVFDENGRCVSVFHLPEEERIAAIRKGRMYGIIRADPEEGIPLVKRYAMKWE